MAFIAVGVTATGALGRVAPPFVSADVALEETVSESPSVSYLRPPVVLATSSGIYIVNPEPQQTQPEEATPEATPAPTPEPTPAPQPAFISHPVHP